MKKVVLATTFLFVLSFSVSSLLGQITLNNSIRGGDEIIKQQVEYKDPGRSGVNVVWDFSSLKAVNPEYSLKYVSAHAYKDSIYILGRDTFLVGEVEDNELVIGLEHYTMYFYQIKDGVQYNLGHRNSTVLMHHKDPIQVMAYPLSYGMDFSKEYSSEGLYSSTEPIFTSGNVSAKYDAFGKMILPSKDTLDHVMRVKTVQSVFENDTLNEQGNIPLSMQIETYRWYSKGYRYPIFEVVKSVNKQESVEETFTTAFFYPPQDHYYLDNDSENVALLDSLNNNNDNGGISDSNNPDCGGSLIENGSFAYNFYPNPVETNLYIEYMLSQEAVVGISLYDLSGRLIKTVADQLHRTGLYNQMIDCSSLSAGHYILRFSVNNEIVNEKIIKK